MRANDRGRFGAMVCWVLEEDPDLTQHLPAPHRWEARQRAAARLLEVGAGNWSPAAAFAELGPPRPGAPRGLLVLDGAIVRELKAGAATGAVLIGPGELVWEPELGDDAIFLPRETRWTALTDLRLALIDAGFLRRLAAWPEISVALLDRAGRHAEMLALQQTIACQVRVEDRVLMLLLAIGERWGRVGKDGIRIDMPLTVTAMAQLVAAQRQTVSTAVTRLSRQGMVKRSTDGWIVRPQAAAELAQADAVSQGM